MADWYARICRTSGEVTFIAVADGADPKAGHDGRRHRFVRLEREPGPHDRFDGATLVRCPASAASAGLAAIDRAHGREAIAAAHAVKTLEARLILVGVPIDGLVAAEARATGQDLARLAATIAARAAEADAAEISRITDKRALRATMED